jgi:hypothetical protein
MVFHQTYFEINQLLKERRSPAHNEGRRLIVIDSQANLAAPTTAIVCTFGQYVNGFAYQVRGQH